MKSRYEDVRLLKDVNYSDQLNWNYLDIKSKKIAVLALIAVIGAANLSHQTSNYDYPKIATQALEEVNYNLDHTYNTKEIELTSDRANLDTKTKESSSEYLIKIAKEYGLTLVNPDESIEKLINAKDYNQSINVLNDYANNYDFRFKTIYQLDETDKQYNINDQSTLDPKYINEYVNLNRFKDTAISIMQALQFTPVEYVKSSGIKEVRLLKGFGRGKKLISSYTGRSSMAGAIAIEEKNLVYFSINSFSPHKGPGLFFHELGHLIDGQQMGGMQQKDPQYLELNPQGFEYLNGDSYQEHKFAVVDEYASHNVIEDKGMMYQNFMYGPRLAYSNNSIIRQKCRLLIARLEENIPNISKYYSALCGIDIEDLKQ